MKISVTFATVFTFAPFAFAANAQAPVNKKEKRQCEAHNKA
jgi:hypothetical protein